jgi:hypothetical protein
MDEKHRARETVAGIALVLALAGSVLAFTGWPQASEAQGSTEDDVRAVQDALNAGDVAQPPDVIADQDAPDSGVGGRQDTGAQGWWQQRLERRRARQQEYLERMRAKQAAARDAQAAAPPPATLTRIDVSFKLDSRVSGPTYGGERWVSPPTYSGVQEGYFSVETRVRGLDAKGQLVDIDPEWIPADPEMVTVSPAQGRDVTITVKRAGKSTLRVASQGVSKEFVIKATYPNNTHIQAEISQKP